MSAAVDVVVVGGGLAGSIAARDLARRGHDVLLVERKEDPGAFNYCAEAVSARALAETYRVRQQEIAAPIDGGLLFGPAGEPCRLRWPGVGYILHRDRLMRDVFEEALEAGATGRLGCSLESIERDEAGRLYGVALRRSARRERVRCRAVVGADGVASMAGRLAGIDTRLDPAQILICAQYRMTGVDVQPGYPEFWIGDVHAPGGYAWIFPRGEGEANVGLGIVATRPSAGAETATRWLKRFRRRRFKSTGKIVTYLTGGIPTLRRDAPTSAQGVVLVGDAARSADALSAAGIAEAMASAAAGARCLDQGLRQDCLDAPSLARADADYRATHRRLATMRRIRGVFDRLDDAGKEALVTACHDAFHDRRIDDMDPLEMFLSLLRASPRLLRYAGSLMARGA